MNLKEILESYRTALHAQYDPNEVDALFYIAVEFLTGFSRNRIISHLDQNLTEEDVTQYNSILRRLRKQEPIQYILEEAYFYGLKFKVNTSVLIPRPETEELVFLIVNDLKNNPHSSKVLDIGTGSGCIAIALKHMLPKAQVSALDISETALAVAKENAVLNKTDITFINSDIRTYSSHEKYDIIVSNPPYITETEAALMESFFGVILVTQSDSAISSTDNSDLPPHPILGDMLALTSACCFAVYVVLMKVKLGSEDRADMQMLLGYVCSD
ncbi:MAG: peptide chain release factor N(5)-glutamine methyltransferase [Pedobacter sp.]|nr:MAG: peptide chain release factor N(5)-glutamine methyltransferase [Pedobacter sp.]